MPNLQAGRNHSIREASKVRKGGLPPPNTDWERGQARLPDLEAFQEAWLRLTAQCSPVTDPLLPYGRSSAFCLLLFVHCLSQFKYGCEASVMSNAIISGT